MVDVSMGDWSDAIAAAADT